MDNAAKAIIIAAGFFIAVMIISLFMYALTSFRTFQSASDNARETIEINAFNKQFTGIIYSAGETSNNEIKGSQLFNLLGLVADNNNKPDGLFYVTINNQQFDSVDKRDALFYYTENLEKMFKITKVDYSDGVISNINITYADGTEI